jgi:hypothetical protein
MPTTIIGGGAATIPLAVHTPVIFTRKNWGDNAPENTWEIRYDLQLVRAVATTAGQDLGSIELIYRYGHVREPDASGFADRMPVDLRGYWVRVCFIGEEGLHTVWVGKIFGEGRDPHGSSDNPSGVQHYTAYEPLQILRRVHLGKSYWWQDDQVQTIGWIPDMNVRDSRGTIVGNRSSVRVYNGSETEESNIGSYLYGGTDTWTRVDYLEYLLHNFVDEADYDPTGPAWTFSGQLDALEELTDSVPVAQGTSVAEVVRRLISTRIGLDYKIVPVAGSGDPTDPAYDPIVGFDLQVFALQSQEYSFGGVTLPTNPNTVRIERANSIDIPRARIAQTDDHRYGSIRVSGAKIVVCCSLYAADQGEGGEAIAKDLVPKWTAALESAYLAGTGNPNDLGSEHDMAREATQYAPVFQLYGAPTDWTAKSTKAAPVLDLSGTLLQTSSGNWQGQVRRTLAHLPLLEGYDYRVVIPFSNNPTGHQPDFLAPMAWVYDGREATEHKGWRALEQLNVNLSVLHNDWGIKIDPSPNQLFAKNHWEGQPQTGTLTIRTSDSKGMVGITGHPYTVQDMVAVRWTDLGGESAERVNMTVTEVTANTIIVNAGSGDALPEQGYTVTVQYVPQSDLTLSVQDEGFDYETLIATLALETDQRLTLGVDLPGARPEDGTLELPVPDAECWVLAPQTVVGVDGRGQLIKSPNSYVELRNDSTRMALIMAGAIARYQSERGRAEILVKGLRPWLHLLGQMLTVVETDGVEIPVHAPITSIAWETEGAPSTIIRTGFAQ